MAEKYFEIAFSGVIKPGADAAVVRQKLGMMFKADEARLAHMFSGKRVYIKRKVDEVTMIKFRNAFEKAGAICEIVELVEAATSADAPGAGSAAQATVASGSAASASEQAPESGGDYVSKYPESEQVPQALLTDPLGIRAEQISDLETDLAPVGSQLVENVETPEPQIDISGIDIAPVGSDLADDDTSAPPPPPDTRGLSMVD